MTFCADNVLEKLAQNVVFFPKESGHLLRLLFKKTYQIVMVSSRDNLIGFNFEKLLKMS